MRKQMAQLHNQKLYLCLNRHNKIILSAASKLLKKCSNFYGAANEAQAEKLFNTNIFFATVDIIESALITRFQQLSKLDSTLSF
ncbi:hypothetical protein PR048_011377 [Dryococelus australis]|uniref:Uncharacterized protein n=1 Tax=Dryococelus australis TaxID=614101 RepID=A0ABQ9HLE7_9NEOP|nr:hypothetical protein PR048_011377 [Dryococelus australis]